MSRSVQVRSGPGECPPARGAPAVSVSPASIEPRVSAGTVLVGIGRTDRGDDAVGPAVVHAVHAGAPGVCVHALEGDPTELWSIWSGATRAFVCDAVVSGAAPGSLHVFDARAAPLPVGLRCSSSHALGLAQAIELARALDRLPAELWVYGVEGADFEPGHGLSPAVAACVPEVAARILRHLAGSACREVPCTSDRFSPR